MENVSLTAAEGARHFGPPAQCAIRELPECGHSAATAHSHTATDGLAK
jgi:hypothetical protein